MRETINNKVPQSIPSKKQKKTPVPEVAEHVAEIDSEALIDLMHFFPCLWNTKLASHKEFDKRKNTWAEICLKLNIDPKQGTYCIYSFF